MEMKEMKEMKGEFLANLDRDQIIGGSSGKLG